MVMLKIARHHLEWTYRDTTDLRKKGVKLYIPMLEMGESQLLQDVEKHIHLVGIYI